MMAAAVEFAAKGYEAASFNQIIEAAEISKGAAYYYFDDKTDLYATVIEYAFERLAEFFGDFSMDKLTTENFWESLEEYSHKSLLRAREFPKLTQLMRSVLNYAKTHPSAPGGTLVMTAARNFTIQYLLRGQELGVIRTDLPQDLLVELVLGVGYATDSWMLDRIDDMTSEEIEHYGSMLTNIHKQICQPPGNV